MSCLEKPDVLTLPSCCGAAVDVEIVDSNTGESLDYSSPIDEDIDGSFLHYQDIPQKAKIIEDYYWRQCLMLVLRVWLLSGGILAAAIRPGLGFMEGKTPSTT